MMQKPPVKLNPRSLADACPDIIGFPLLILCENGWGWTHYSDPKPVLVDDLPFNGHVIEVIPERYIDFTGPRSGLVGKVLSSPAGFGFKHFVAFIMADGCDYNFENNIPPWRIFLGEGEVNLEVEWFPVLIGKDVWSGYGRLASREKYFNPPVSMENFV
ncbi:MAG: hypothetical protein JJU05_10745 [Verrucomicrobia bacterium]|nr:hypothetical protein [Verrucomicrobiota bacterium]MCH8528623.1 hypothetical protein [Kiritimatiellia bacterium]